MKGNLSSVVVLKHCIAKNAPHLYQGSSNVARCEFADLMEAPAALLVKLKGALFATEHSAFRRRRLTLSI
jgi:hypothetical protein